MQQPKFIPLNAPELGPEEQAKRASDFFELMNRRRTVREYSPREVQIELVERAIATAGTAPSGTNMQLWCITTWNDLRRAQLPSAPLDR